MDSGDWMATKIFQDYKPPWKRRFPTRNDPAGRTPSSVVSTRFAFTPLVFIPSSSLHSTKPIQVPAMNPPKTGDLDYIHFLVAAQKEFTCTEASRSYPEEEDAPAHDAFTRLLQRRPPTRGIPRSRKISMPKRRGAAQPHLDVDPGLPAVGAAPSGDGDQLLRVENRNYSRSDPGVFGRPDPRSALKCVSPNANLFSFSRRNC